MTRDQDFESAEKKIVNPNPTSNQKKKKPVKYETEIQIFSE